jgi:ABC-type protease/lipase transport system fused ATPase/permease subunit
MASNRSEPFTIVADRIFILRDGVTLMFGPRAEVLARLAQQQQSVSRLQPVPKRGTSHG